MTTENLVSPDAETQNPAPELANETPEVAIPEVEAAAPESTESEESKALKRMQRRIDKRTADVYRERAEKEQLAQRIAELERRHAPQQDEVADEPVSKTDVMSLAQEIAKQQEVAKHVQSVLKAGKALPNFDEACNTVAEELPFYDGKGKPTDFLSAVLEFDDPAKLLHHLGTNPDLAAELADMTPTRRVRRLDAIEREMNDRAKPKTSTAPKPLEPVKATASDTGLHSKLSDEEWIRRRDKEVRERGRY
jgi:hypothetical protein